MSYHRDVSHSIRCLKEENDGREGMVGGSDGREGVAGGREGREGVVGGRDGREGMVGGREGGMVGREWWEGWRQVWILRR
jgi:hypothetical protein